MAEPILLAQRGAIECHLLPALANRHGLITGATGTGKTITLQTLAESFSRRGVPVFMADVKGDLTGISQAGSIGDKLAAVLKERGIAAPEPFACPATLWDVFGEQGHPVRATVSDMGPLLLARMLALNETQQGVLSLVFKVADDNGLLLLDLKDLRAMLQHVGDNAAQFTTEYGNVSAASIGAIQRGLLQIEEQGGDRFFGEPMLNIADFMQTADGKGVVNILAADKLMNSPRLYATFLLWMLSELFEQLPEVGDLDEPKLVFFFDEAHLLFKDAPAALVERIELVVRLVRSKGVGVYFVTQNPLDIPDTRARAARQPRAARAARLHAARPEGGQGGGRARCAPTRGSTSRPRSPSSPSARRWSACSTPRAGPARPSASSCCRRAARSGRSRPSSARRSSPARWWPASTRRRSTASRPTRSSRAAPRRQADAAGGLADEGARATAAGGGPRRAADGGLLGGLKDVLFGSTGPRGGKHEGLAESAARSAVRTIGSSVGREIVRGVLGSLLGGSRRR